MIGHGGGGWRRGARDLRRRNTLLEEPHLLFQCSDPYRVQLDPAHDQQSKSRVFPLLDIQRGEDIVRTSNPSACRTGRNTTLLTIQGPTRLIPDVVAPSLFFTDARGVLSVARCGHK